VIAYRELLDTNHDVAVSDLHVVIDEAFFSIDNTKSDPHTLADPIAKANTV
jgi:hypothetical protein